MRSEMWFEAKRSVGHQKYAMDVLAGETSAQPFDIEIPYHRITCTLAGKMSDKKRKRHDAASSGRPHKKAATESPPENIQISVIENGDEWAPVLGAYIQNHCYASAIGHLLTF